MRALSPCNRAFTQAVPAFMRSHATALYSENYLR